MRLVLIGDGESPHLLKWARALARTPGVELWAASSRGFLPDFLAVVPTERTLALGTRPDAGGGNVGLLRELPRLARWLRSVRADWLHAHYLSSHGTLAWLAKACFGVPGRIVASAWGSDILVAPQRSAVLRFATTRVLRTAALCTSDSQVMAQRMHKLGAHEVMVFPFGLESMPEEAASKDRDLVFANRGLEPLYDPARVLEVFAAMRAALPGLRLVVANDGSLRTELPATVQRLGLGECVQFVGRLDAVTQEAWYGRALWYLSLPRSDSVAVSVLEAMAYGCVPILSDLPANRELVRDGGNGLLLGAGAAPLPGQLADLRQRAETIAGDNRAWVREHALFEPAVRAFVERLRALEPR